VRFVQQLDQALAILDSTILYVASRVIYSSLKDAGRLIVEERPPVSAIPG